MFVGQDGGQWGGRARREEGMSSEERKDRDKTRGLERREVKDRNCGMKAPKGGDVQKTEGEQGMALPAEECLSR